MAIISSREDEITITHQLQDVVLLLHEFLEIDDEPGDNQQELLLQVENGVLKALGEYFEVAGQARNLADELLSTKITNAFLAEESHRAQKVFGALMSPPEFDDLLSEALELLIREGDATTRVLANGEIGAAFGKSYLKEALAMAITAYNNELVMKLVKK
jgi:hypothetical protein